MLSTPRRAAALTGILVSLFALSGFAGLVYESVWSAYLRLLLGHAAYAQTLVIATFMGGLAAGAWLASRVSPRSRDLLIAYAAVEGAIGLLALAFHPLFDAGTALLHAEALPALGPGTAGAAVRWSFAALLVLPPTVLLGMTFPLMAGALARRIPAAAGQAIALAYFANSAGGAAGVLVSGFVLLPDLGLPGAMKAAGALNLAIAALAWATARAGAPAREPVGDARRFAGTHAPRLLLAAALITGAASFVYEVAWLRMLALVLGASTHAFELMLSAFVLGLALGSLWIRRRVDTLDSPMRFLGLVQVAMGALAVATLFFYGATFDLMDLVLRALAPNDTGYALFSTASHGIAMLIMVPVTFLAGATLPLITRLALDAGRGERGIGEVYAANTVGAIAGVLFALHAGLPSLGLEGSMAVGAALDIALGAVLLHRAGARAAPVTAAAALCVVAALAVSPLDPRRMASGVFGRFDPDRFQGAEVLRHRDGKTATVTVLGREDGAVSIKTNGKTDAAMSMRAQRPPTLDEHTMILLAALPLAAVPQARTAAVVGFGSGLTTHVLLAAPAVERVDTVEIEPAMVEGARSFGIRVERAFRDPRSRVVIEDARSWFAAATGGYDIVVSEPSNPWVSGVASLYTVEFYRLVRGRLAPHGVLAQWLHVRDLAPDLLASVAASLGEVFEDYAIFDLNGGDALLLAGAAHAIGLDAGAPLAWDAMATELARIGVRSTAGLAAHRVAGRATAGHWLERLAAAPNTDYRPLLEYGAVRARFKRSRATGVFALAVAPLPVVEMVEGRLPPPASAPGPNPHVARVRATREAHAIAAALSSDPAAPAPLAAGDPARLAEQARLAWAGCGTTAPRIWLDSLLEVAKKTIPYRTPEALRDQWTALDAGACERRWSPRQRRWAALVEAVSERDAGAMRALAARMLEAHDGQAHDQIRYLLGAGLLGMVTAGRLEEARALWSHYAGAALGTDPPPPYLTALATLAAP